MLRPRLSGALLALLLGTTLGCSSTSGQQPSAGSGADSATGSTSGQGSGPAAIPRLGACRALTPKATEKPSDSSPEVACTKAHTAETFAIGSFPKALAGSSYDSERLGAYIYRVCGKAYVGFLGGDESIAIRSLLSWAWFRPTRTAWAKQARWYRCDVVGGPENVSAYRPLPQTARGFLSGRPPETWMACARGQRFAGSAKVPCATPHDWRAVTTIKLGGPKEPYPGDRLAQIRSRQYCSDSVGAWLNYPTADFDYGVTVFHEAEWKTGNRRSICWARTDR